MNTCYTLCTNILSYTYKYTKYCATLGYTLTKHLRDPQTYSWWHQIDENLYLGGVPIAYLGHVEKLHADVGIQFVLSVLEDFELNVETSQWNQVGIENSVVNAVDFNAVPIETINQCVELLRKQLNDSKRCYVHCRAGVGRSATVIICYLLKYGLHNGVKFQSVKTASHYVKNLRPQLNLNSEQKLAVYDYYETYVKTMLT